MNDLIKREDAIKAIHNYWKKRLDTLPTKESECGEVYADIQQMDKILEHNKTLCNFINAIPSVDRPQGEWVKKPHKVYLPRDYEPDIIDYRDRQYNEEDHSIIQYWWHCNQCDYEAIRWAKPTANFCPNCGTRMKGADDE